ncbi:hypothetical protein [Neosynechococcus sphagnicola]|uniref:hypothetical protein n=1 Tax=Neosynechococcus sphagnicola TaxID=1501145 RepID=UPI0006918080|nr:hypothetical protein [Neosynechococcus sphagnicola]
MLERTTTATCIENWTEDLKLLAWRERFLEVGMRSLQVCSTTSKRPLEGLLLVGTESPRTWTQAEQEIVCTVGQQLGVILTHWHQQRQNKQQQEIAQTIQWGLTTFQQLQQVDQLEKSAVQMIAQVVMEAPLAALISWSPGRPVGQITAAFSTSPAFGLTLNATVPVHSDALIQRTLATDGLLALTIDEIAVETCQWLKATGIGQVLTLALRTSPEFEPTGVILVADQPDRRWSERCLNALGTLTSQFAWSRRHLQLTYLLNTQREYLERLNWYKLCRWEEFYRSIGAGVRKLGDLAPSPTGSTTLPPSPPGSSTPPNRRHQDGLRQLNDTLSAIAPMVQKEQWRLQTQTDTVLLTSLLKRSLERVDHLIQQRQLWSQVHNLPEESPPGDGESPHSGRRDQD